MRFRLLVLLTMLLTLNACTMLQPMADDSAVPAAPSTIGAPGLDDPLFPLEGNGGIDVQHYLLEIDWDDATGAIDAVATLTIEATQDLSAFNLDFYGLEISAITVNSEPANFTRDAAELTITLPTLMAIGDTFEVTVAYSGIPEPIPDSVTSGWTVTDNGAYVLGEPNVAKNWFPSNNHPTDKASYTFPSRRLNPSMWRPMVCPAHQWIMATL
ncbi:MAG: hypothetical protein R2911_21310 [Caldilineaceae bacterium]